MQKGNVKDSSARAGSEVLREQAHRPGPKPSLTLEQIAEAAIRLADAEGLQSVSMERVAREVRVTTMALYRYFPGKQALIELMIEHGAPGVPDLRGAKNWRDKMVAWMRALRSMYRAHPWLLTATLGARQMGPNELRWLDSAVAILGEAGVLASQRHDIFLVLIGHARSNAEFESLKSRGASLQWDSAELLRHRDSLPALAEAVEGGAFPSRGSDGFEVGLNCILDGIESLTRKQRRGRRIRR